MSPVVQICIACMHFAVTWNRQLLAVYYMVHFYLPSPKKIFVRVEYKTIDIGSSVRVMVHVKVEVILYMC